MDNRYLLIDGLKTDSIYVIYELKHIRSDLILWTLDLIGSSLDHIWSDALAYHLIYNSCLISFMWKAIGSLMYIRQIISWSKLITFVVGIIPLEHMSSNKVIAGKVCPLYCIEGAYMTCPSSGNEQLSPSCNCCLAPNGCVIYNSDGTPICS